MSKSMIQVDDTLYDYILSVVLREPPLLARLREETARMPQSNMQIAPDQGQFMGLLVELLGARRAVEIGTFTGYSALTLALAMGETGRLVACDVSEEFTRIARRYWQEAGIAERIDLRLAPALETLAALEREGWAGTVDFVFIDADKENYLNYYEAALRLLRPGGLAAIDNVLWDGAVCDPKDTSESTLAIRALNERLHADDRISLSLVPVGDGLTLARKRPKP